MPSQHPRVIVTKAWTTWPFDQRIALSVDPRYGDTDDLSSNAGARQQHVQRIVSCARVPNYSNRIKWKVQFLIELRLPHSYNEACWLIRPGLSPNRQSKEGRRPKLGVQLHCGQHAIGRASCRTRTSLLDHRRQAWRCVPQ